MAGLIFRTKIKPIVNAFVLIYTHLGIFNLIPIYFCTDDRLPSVLNSQKAMSSNETETIEKNELSDYSNFHLIAEQVFTDRTLIRTNSITPVERGYRADTSPKASRTITHESNILVDQSQWFTLCFYFPIFNT